MVKMVIVKVWMVMEDCGNGSSDSGCSLHYGSKIVNWIVVKENKDVGNCESVMKMVDYITKVFFFFF